MNLDNRTIIVTGGASGIGQATGRHLASLGARIGILDLDADAVSAAVADIESAGGQAIALTGDTTDEVSVADAVAKTLDRFGALDGLVTCAGVRQTGAPVQNIAVDVWLKTIHVNLTGSFIAMRGVLPTMIEARKGAIVAIGSVSGKLPRLDKAAYSASKAGVLHLTRSVALEVAQYGIRANVVSPGTTNTPMFKLATEKEGADEYQNRIFGSSEKFRPGVPLRRMAETEDQANAIAFLLSDEASFITGQVLFVDGGESMI